MKEDPPPTQVYPITINTLITLETSYQQDTTRQKAISDIVCIRLFLLIRPGEYYSGVTDTYPNYFNLINTQLFNGAQHHNYATVPKSISPQ